MKFSERHKLWKPILQKINNLNNSVSIKEIEFEIKAFPQRELEAQMTSLVTLTRYLRKK